MKRVTISMLALLFLIPSADARRKKEAAGVVKVDVYQDAQYGFRLKLNADWKSKIGTDEENLRMVLVQKNYGIPTQFKDSPDYTVIPRIAVYADTSGMSAQALLDSIVSSTFKSKQKKEMLKEFEFLGQSGIIPKNKRFLTIGGETSVLWEGSVKYTKEVSSASSSDQGIRVTGGYGGALIVTKKVNRVVLFHVMAEMQFFDDVMKSTTAIAGSLEWTDPTKE